MSNAGSGYYVADFNFTLTEERSFIQIQPPPGIKLETKDNNDGTKSVTGFVVTVKASTEDEALNKAKTEAKRLVDLLAVLSGDTLALPLEVIIYVVLMEEIRYLKYSDPDTTLIPQS